MPGIDGPAIDEIVISAIPGETCLALLSNGQTIEIIIDRGHAMTGDVLLGRVISVNRATNAAFLDIGEGVPGFLPSPGRLNEGDKTLVQVTAGARRDKGAALTTGIVLRRHYWIYTADQGRRTLLKGQVDDATRDRLTAMIAPLLTPPKSFSPLAEAARADEQALIDDMNRLRTQWKTLERASTASSSPATSRLLAPSALERALADHGATVTTVRVDDGASLAEARRLYPAAILEMNAFETCGAADALEQALDPEVMLPGGGRLIIEETAACTLIDIDAGGRPPMEANLAALPLIAAQIRLRGLAGHILVDTIPSKNRRAHADMLALFRQYLNADPTPARLVGVTPLGSVELTRERKRPSLGEIMLRERQTTLNAASIGLAGLRAVLKAVKTRPTVIPTLVAAPAVIAALRQQTALLAAIADRLGRPLALREQAGLETFELAEDKR